MRSPGALQRVAAVRPLVLANEAANVRIRGHEFKRLVAGAPRHAELLERLAVERDQVLARRLPTRRVGVELDHERPHPHAVWQRHRQRAQRAAESGRCEHPWRAAARTSSSG